MLKYTYTYIYTHTHSLVQYIIYVIYIKILYTHTHTLYRYEIGTFMCSTNKKTEAEEAKDLTQLSVRTIFQPQVSES